MIISFPFSLLLKTCIICGTIVYLFVFSEVIGGFGMFVLFV